MSTTGSTILASLLLTASALAAEPVALVGGTTPAGVRLDLVVQDGKIVSHEVTSAWAQAARTDITGKCLTPGFIDSHVHLAYRPEAAAMASGGIAAAVDLGSPIAFLTNRPTELTMLAAGPMITAAGGYPTQSWGKDGYGIQVLGPRDAADAVDRLAKAGAQMIKVPFAQGRVLTEAELDAVMERARVHRLRVVAHALTDGSANRAGKAGADVLAHTPNEPLSDETVAIWSTRAVITTLDAFGGSDVAVDNLRRLREAGATILYGTDFGNSRVAGINAQELALMGKAGMDEKAILEAATSTPARFWRLTDFGSLDVGKSDAVWVGDCSCAWCVH